MNFSSYGTNIEIVQFDGNFFTLVLFIWRYEWTLWCWRYPFFFPYLALPSSKQHTSKRCLNTSNRKKKIFFWLVLIREIQSLLSHQVLHACYMHRQFHSIYFITLIICCEWYKVWRFNFAVSPAFCYFVCHKSKYFPQKPLLKLPSTRKQKHIMRAEKIDTSRHQQVCVLYSRLIWCCLVRKMIGELSRINR